MIETIRYTNQLPVMESFYTLQGEGFHQGRAAYFIRLAGCDVGCFWCDVKDSWNVHEEQWQTVEAIVEKAQQFAGRLAVITGGEPLMHQLGTLTQTLQQNGFETNIETSGSHPLSGSWNWICLSPKKFKQPLPEAFEKANELKVVVYNKSDFDWALKNAEKVSPGCRLYLQPEWGKRDEITPLIVEFIKLNPAWTLSIQTHKFIDVP